MAQLLSLGAEAAAGGLFGIVGTALGRVAGFFEGRQKNKHEVARWAHEVQLHELNMKSRAQEAEIELAITQQEGSWKGLAMSLEADAKLGTGSQWVVDTLRLVRPTLTLLLWLITAWIFMSTEAMQIAEAAVFAATAATLWWFGDRAPRPNGYGVGASAYPGG
jgi:hypothetical protein